MKPTLALSVLVFLAGTVRAGLFSVDDPCPFTVSAEGVAQPLPIAQFVSMLNDRFGGRVPFDPGKPETHDWIFDSSSAVPAWRIAYAGRLHHWVSVRRMKAKELPSDELASYVAALIRLEVHGEAFEVLQPALRSRSPDYRAIAHVVHIHAERGEWEAARSRYLGLLEADDTGPIRGTSKPQWHWQRDIDATLLERMIVARLKGTDRTAKIEDAMPDAIFETADGRPIHYWSDAEEAKLLPADAIARVQQLSLWHPGDARLLWTLAELYAASGLWSEAGKLDAMLTEGRKFGGPKRFREHRRQVLDELTKQPTPQGGSSDIPFETEDEVRPPNDRLFGLIDRSSLWLAGSLFVLVAAAMVVLQIRSLRRRSGR